MDKNFGKIQYLFMIRTLNEVDIEGTDLNTVKAISDEARASPAVPMVKNPAASAGDGWGEPLQQRMVAHSSILAWRIPWTEEPGGLWSIGLQRAGHD